MINRQYVLRIKYTPKTTYDNITLGDKSLSRIIHKALEEQGIRIELTQAVEFVDSTDLIDLEEIFNPTIEEDE